MKQFRIALAVLGIVICLLASNWSVVTADPVSYSSSNNRSNASVAYEAEFRQAIGFRSDLAYISDVRASRTSIYVPSFGGIVLTPGEFEELQTRLDLEVDANTLIEFFSQHPDLQSTLGGVYIEHFAGAEDYTKGGQLVLQLAGTRIQSQDVLQEVNLKRPERLQIELVSFSQTELNEQYDALIALDSTMLQSVFIDTKLNRVGVIVDLPFQSQGSGEPLNKQDLPINLSFFVSHPSINVYNGKILVERVLWRGGDAWGKTKNQRDCTLGFKVRENATRRYGMVTAGHCITELGLHKDSRVYGPTRVAIVGDYLDGATSPYGAGIDAAVLRTSSNTGTDDVNYFTSHFDIIGSTSDYTVGKIRCFTGQKSGTKCSPITCQNYEFVYQGRYYTRQFTVDSDPTNGDSGSPVYEVVGQTNTVRITGVLGTRIRTLPGTISCMNGWDGGASRFDDVMSYLDLSLETRH